MININLLKYIDKSLSEIHQIEHFEFDDADDVKNKGLFQNIFQPKYIYIAASFLIFLALAVFTYFLFAPTKTQTVEHTVAKTEKIIGKNEKEKQTSDEEFKKIGSITFIENNISDRPLKTDGKQVESEGIKEDTGEIAPNPQKTQKPIKQQMTSQPEKKQTTHSKQHIQEKKTVDSVEYIIVINNINEKLINDIAKTAKQNGLQFNKKVSSEKKGTLWKVYTPSESGKTRIGDVRVVLKGKFSSKKQAVNYAKKIPGKVFVKKSFYSYNLYDITIEGFKQINDAKKFAKTINVGDNPIKITKKP